jgi:hypothetical protein
MFSGSMYNCPRCGKFLLADSLDATLEGYLDDRTIQRSVLSHYIQRKQINNRSLVVVDDIDLNYLKGREPPNPQEQLDNLLLWIGSNQASPAATPSPALNVWLRLSAQQLHRASRVSQVSDGCSGSMATTTIYSFEIFMLPEVNWTFS